MGLDELGPEVLFTIAGVERLDLHRLYRVMACSSRVSEQQQGGGTPIRAVQPQRMGLPRPLLN